MFFRWTGRLGPVVVAGLLAAIFAAPAQAGTAQAATRIASDAVHSKLEALKEWGLRESTAKKALKAWEKARRKVANPRYFAVIDFGIHSSKERLFLIDTETGKAQALLVSHGQGSDPDHDGWADSFSNVEGSKMSSLGGYLTAEIYYGKHGMSLRLDGLEPTNSRARQRAIVMHGADYVDPDRRVLGRSWGCPAIERKYVKRLLPKIAGGSFLYIAK